MPGSLGLRHVDHVGIAVRSIAAATRLFVDLLGGEFVNGGVDPVLGIRTVQLRLPNRIRFELLEPATPDSYLHDYLDRRGEGVHHVTLLVEDLSTALAELAEAGYETVDTDTSAPHWKQTYLRPRSAHGVLLQVAESDLDWDVPLEGVTLEAVLAGDFLWQGGRSVPRRDVDG